MGRRESLDSVVDRGGQVTQARKAAAIFRYNYFVEARIWFCDSRFDSFVRGALFDLLSGHP